MNNSKFIFLVGYFGFGNTGDEAILSAMLAHFRGQRSDLHFVVASGDPEQTTAAHGVVAIRWTDIAAIYHSVESADLVVIGGGGLFHDYWGLDPDSLLTSRHWGITYYAGPALLARLYRKPLMLFGVGVGPLYSAYGKELTRRAAMGATAITVRDGESKRLLEQLGVPAQAVRLTADPGFLLDLNRSGSLQQALPSGFELKRPVLAIAARHWSVGVYPDYLERELAAAIDVFIRQTGGSAVLVPFQHSLGEREDDTATARRIRGHMRLGDDQVAIARPGSPNEIYSWLHDSDLVLGMRLHALVFAAMAGVPAVALIYDPKVQELVGRLGTGEFALDVKDVDARRLADQLAGALARREELGQAMRIAAGEMRQEAFENISIAVGLLEVLPVDAGTRLDGLDLFEERDTERASALSQQLQRSEAERRDIARMLTVAETSLSEAESRIRALRSSLAGLQSRLDAETAQRENYAVTLRDADATRAALIAEIDRFEALFQKALAGYRSQRAWKGMLLLRKGYTLFHRSVLDFLGWGAGLLFGRTGDLEEHELGFPSIHVPETWRAARKIAAPAEAQTAAEAPSAAPEDRPPQRDRYDVVILAIIDYDFRFQRPQQVAAEFARRGHRVFWISPSRFLPASSPAAYETVALRENVWEVHLRSRQPDIYLGELLPEHVEAMAAALHDLYRDWGIAEHTVLLQLPFWRRLALELRSSYGGPLLYDCMDDWETFENLGPFNVSEERDLVRECDVLVVTGAELVRKFRDQGLNPLLARNGADYAFFAAARPNDLLAGVPRPVIGYFGAIADWIDLDLVCAVARSRPQYSFVLIGQVFGRDVSALEALENVRLLGNRPYADIPSYLHNFDACLIPFLLNQVTKATDPVKLYEYLSLGKPVIATDMAELGQCGDLLYIGRDPEDFARKVDEAIAEKDPDLVRRRIEFARANTWSSRVQEIDAGVRAAFPLLSILIVTYNSECFVRPCLDSILRNTSYPEFEVLLVDNGSTDGTVELLQEYAERDGRLRICPLAENLGFAGGNNHAARLSRGRHLIFLNIDTMVTPGWVGLLLRHIHRDPSIGLLCPVTNFAGNEVKINVSYSEWKGMERFARALAAVKTGEKLAIRVAPLYCALMPREVWENVGEMDTRYEIGMFEDDDLSLRVKQAGYGIYAAEDCFIHHFGQGSFSKLPDEAYNRIFEANRKRFESKWKQPWVVHRTRPGVRPPFEEKRFEPAAFVAG